MFLLHLLISSVVEKAAPVRIRFKCPVCEARDATGVAYDQTERYKTLLVVPFRTERTTWVTCAACKSVSQSEIPVAELVRQAPGEINRYIRRRLPHLLVILLVLGIPFALFPVIGVIFSLTVLAAGGKYGGWVRGLAVTEVVLSVCFTLLMALALLLPEPAYEKPRFAPIRQPAPVSAPATAPAKP
jgi:hypothetical protein